MAIFQQLALLVPGMVLGPITNQGEPNTLGRIASAVLQPPILLKQPLLIASAFARSARRTHESIVTTFQ